MILVLISEFMQDEIYLNIESQYYQQFNQVIVFSVKGHVYDNKRLVLQKNMVYGKKDITYKSNIDRMRYLCKGLFHRYGYQEFGNLIKSKKINKNTIKSYALFTAKTELLTETMKNILLKRITSSDEKIIFYSYRFGIGALAGIRLKKFFHNAKVIARCHGQDLFEFRNEDYYLPYRKALYSQIDKIFCISEDGKNYISTQYPQYSKKAEVFRLGTKDIGENKNLTNQSLTLVSCSRIVPIKRLELIVDALCQIKDTHVQWIHFGNGDKDYTKTIIEKTKKVGKNITCQFKGFVDNQHLVKEYLNGSFSAFINVSESEGLPVSIMEAMSVGMPIIATDVGGTAEIVYDKKNGYLLKKDFATGDLVKAIQEISLMTEKNFDKMCQNSRKAWEEKCSEEKNYKEFIERILSFQEGLE